MAIHTVQSATVTDPTTLSPGLQEFWYLPPGSTGVWSGEDGRLATSLELDNTTWSFIDPEEGDAIYNLGDDSISKIEGGVLVRIAPARRFLARKNGGLALTGSYDPITDWTELAISPEMSFDESLGELEFLEDLGFVLVQTTVHIERTSGSQSAEGGSRFQINTGFSFNDLSETTQTGQIPGPLPPAIIGEATAGHKIRLTAFAGTPGAYEVSQNGTSWLITEIV